MEPAKGEVCGNPLLSPGGFEATGGLGCASPCIPEDTRVVREMARCDASILRSEIEEKEVYPPADDIGVLRFPVVCVRDCDHMRPVPHLLFGNFSLSSFGDENFDVLRGDANRSVRAYLINVDDSVVGIVDKPFSDCSTHLLAQIFQ
jgi:hypothetical protein